jgi:hypothetical protein
MSNLWNAYKSWAKKHSRTCFNIWYYGVLLTAIILGIYLLVTWDANVSLWIIELSYIIGLTIFYFYKEGFINFINDVL